MFRSESSRERALLRLIEQQQRTIDNLTDRLMYLAGQTWTPPPLQPEPEVEDVPEMVSALHGVPPGYEYDDEDE